MGLCQRKKKIRGTRSRVMKNGSASEKSEGACLRTEVLSRGVDSIGT